MRALKRTSFVSFEQLFEDYLTNCRPVLLEKDFANDRLFSWTPDNLKTRIGHAIVKINSASKGEYHLDQAKGGFVEAPVYMKFRDFVDNKIHSGSYYLQQTSITEAFPELIDDIPYRELLEPSLIKVMNIWIGGAGTITPLHYDFANNFFIQCFGQKKVILYEAWQTPYLYPYEVQHNLHPYVSRLDIHRPDLEAFPEFSKADPIEIILQPGDVLFMPSTTWHQVESESISISVNIWFRQFDFQYTWPNMLRLFYYKYSTLPYLHQVTVPYQFADVLAFCDHLLAAEHYLEAGISYVAVLENLLRKKAIEHHISFGDRQQKGRLRNDIQEAIIHHRSLLDNGLYDAADREQVLFFLKTGEAMLEKQVLPFDTGQAGEFCKNIRTTIIRLSGGGRHL